MKRADRMGSPAIAGTVPVPDGFREVRDFIEDENRHPGTSPFSMTMVVTMPCCGFAFDAECFDYAPGVSVMHSPPRWTCTECERTYEACQGAGLVEVLEPLPRWRIEVDLMRQLGLRHYIAVTRSQIVFWRWMRRRAREEARHA